MAVRLELLGIDQQVREVVMRRRFSLDIPGTLGDACDPATMAVIVYGMQAGVVGQLPEGGAGTVERVSRVLTAARAGGYPVFFTRHMSLPARLMGVAQRRTAMAWQRVDDPEKVQSWFLRDTPGFQIVPDLSPRADEAVFDKLAMSAFAGTPLEMALRDLGIRAFAIAGVALEIGIGPTIWHAVDLGFILSL
jgi:biuret amidohydrolase